MLRDHNTRSLIVATALVAALLSACAGEAESSSPAGGGFKVDKLFTHDGCTVYRFIDAGRFRYFTRCESARASVSWSEGCGKGCTRQVEVPTGRPNGGTQ